MTPAREIKERYFMNFVYTCFAVLCFLQAEALGKPIWYPPIFLELPIGWTVARKSTPDSQAFVLHKGTKRVVFDYGRRYDKDILRP